MITLRIEHQITDLDTWSAMFSRFADARAQGGVRGHRVHHPTDDEHYVCVDLDFDDLPTAQAYESFLRTEVWASSTAAPALASAPMTRTLMEVRA